MLGDRSILKEYHSSPMQDFKTTATRNIPIVKSEERKNNKH